MLNLVRRASGAVLIGAIVLACGGGAPTTSGAPTTGPGATGPAVTVNPDQDLESLIPDTVGGNAFAVESAQGASIVALLPGTDDAELNDIVSDLGTSTDKLSAAYGLGLWPGASAGEFTGLSLLAFRVEGKPAGETLTRFLTTVQADAPNSTTSQETVGGKTVTAVFDPEDADDTVYLYGTGDILFMIGGTPAHVEEVFGQLP